MQRAKTIMFQGTASGVGKSVLATLFCRYFCNQGYRVVPFKAQNITTVTFQTPAGIMGKSQAIQSWASALEPHPVMNPLLLCPLAKNRVKVYLCGEFLGERTWDNCRQEIIPLAKKKIKESFQRLCAEYELVIIEGAGSPVEINLAATDLANLFMSQLAGFPVFLIADIDRGGVFASLVGTLSLMQKEARERVAGLIINKFKGNLELFQPGIDFLEKKTGLPVLAVFPYLNDLPIEDEDELVSAGSKKKFIPMAPDQLRDELDGMMPIMQKFVAWKRLLEIMSISAPRSSK